jgi:hypothetical protein
MQVDKGSRQPNEVDKEETNLLVILKLQTPSSGITSLVTSVLLIFFFKRQVRYNYLQARLKIVFPIYA